MFCPRVLSTFSLLFSLATASSNPVFYDNTWAGAAQVQQNGSSPFSSIEATLVMPHLKLPKHPHQSVDQYSASYWIGVDGYKSPSHTGLWQAGVAMHIYANGTTEYVGFWEWVPDPETYLYNDLKILEGHHVHVGLNISTDGKFATATLKNLNTTETISNTRAAPTAWRAPDWTLAGASAEWIVESGTYQNFTRQVLPNWGTATFLNAQAYKRDGTRVLPGSPEGFQEFENFWLDTNMLYTKSSVKGDTVSVQYIEEKCQKCGEICSKAGTCFNATTSG